MVTLSLVGLGLPLVAASNEQMVGVVIMHGKGGNPNRHVSDLASTLKDTGFLVANIEMPWSGNRNYDVGVSDAENEVETAISDLRSKGAKKIFVAGHSQGGVFALHFAGNHRPDGIIAIAPGGNVGSNNFREKLGNSVERAIQLVADGKGNEKTRLSDFEGKKGVYPIVTAPLIYLTWFAPDGAMNMRRAAQEANPEIPILWIVAKHDYPGLRKANIPLFDMLPENPNKRLFEPNSDHFDAPSASAEEIVRWISQVVGTRR
jgi:pimeloyl-ACP methyl ester carboxylesterase